jgi:hypothetical protein
LWKLYRFNSCSRRVGGSSPANRRSNPCRCGHQLLIVTLTKLIETTGEIQRNGLIELVRDPERHQGLKLLYWDGTEVRIRPIWPVTFGSESAVFKPTTIEPTVLRAIYLPEGATPYGSTRELFDSLSSLLKKFTALPENHVALLAHAVLASWLVEHTDIAITVALVGPDGPARRQVFRLLYSLFRRALVLNTANPANLFTLPMALTPSLFIASCEPGAALQSFLHATSSRGAQFVNKGRLVDLCCAKVFATDEPLHHSLGGFPILEIPIAPGRPSTPFLEYEAQRKILEEYQPKLLMYRLTNLLQIRNWHFDDVDLEVPWRDVTSCLAATATSDSQLQASVVELLKDQEAAFRADSGRFFRKTVLEASLTLCHGATQNALTVGDITRAANELLKGAGETLTLEPRAVGDILRSLRIPTERLGAKGRGIVLLKDVQRRLHAIAMDYGIDLRNTAPKDCQICFEIDPEYGMQNPLNSITPEVFS